jgi:hypothetical protein
LQNKFCTPVLQFEISFDLQNKFCTPALQFEISFALNRTKILSILTLSASCAIILATLVLFLIFYHHLSVPMSKAFALSKK